MSRFNLNLGVYKLELLEGGVWAQEQLLTGKLARVEAEKKTFCTEHQIRPKLVKLSHLQYQSDGTIGWVDTTINQNYTTEPMNRLKELFYQTRCELTESGYQRFARITGLAKDTVINLMRRPTTSAHVPISREGLIYIEYKVQEWKSQDSGDGLQEKE